MGEVAVSGVIVGPGVKNAVFEGRSRGNIRQKQCGGEWLFLALFGKISQKMAETGRGVKKSLRGI